MDTQVDPVVNGCYLGKNNEMFKIKMLGYLRNNIQYVVVEDTYGNVKSIKYRSWQNMYLIPCCMSSPTVRKQSLYPA